MPGCTILILTYKGKHHLEYLLPTVNDAIENYAGTHTPDVLIIDNGSDEDTRNYVHQFFPGIKYYFSPVNDYLFSLNKFVREIESEFVFILNDDVKLDKNILNHLLPVISGDSQLFAVSCKFLDWDTGVPASGVRAVSYKKGWLSHQFLDLSETGTRYTLYACGGGAVFRTGMFNELNGFDSLFRPGYSEDTDLGIRAWQRGWKIIYHPPAFLYHREGGTMKEYFENNRLTRVIYRNHILWLLKNIRVPGFLFWFFLLFPYRLVYNFLYNKNQYYAMMRAIPLMGKAIAARSGYIGKYDDDRTWFAEVNQLYKAGNS